MENTAADSTSLIGCSSIGWEVGRYAKGLAVPGSPVLMIQPELPHTKEHQDDRYHQGISWAAQPRSHDTR